MNFLGSKDFNLFKNISFIARVGTDFPEAFTLLFSVEVFFHFRFIVLKKGVKMNFFEVDINF